MTQLSKHHFVAYLQKLADQEERGALASLRRGLGHPPGTAPEMFRYVIPHLPTEVSRTQEAAYYLVAALFALHPKSCENGNIGDHMAHARDGNNDDAIERRFTALLMAHPDDLPDHLRQAISFLKSKDIPVNWEQLLRDLQNWDNPDWRTGVQKRWARYFWGRQNAVAEQKD